MTRLRRTQMIAVIPVLACAGLLLALAAPAAAQSEACVHLQVGSGYTAVITVIPCCPPTKEGFVEFSSDPFTAGQTQCLSLEPVEDGGTFTVAVGPSTGGGSTGCEPHSLRRAASLSASVTFNASGTAQNIHCVAPTGATQPSASPSR